jgi:mannose-6-phosphate isomerase-like protein (cupin superfamily)
MSALVRRALAAGLLSLAASLCVTAGFAQPPQGPAPPPATIVAWAPKPSPANAWRAPHRPHWRFADIVRDHAGQTRWREPIVADRDFNATYVSMAPGDATTPQMWADSRTFWVVLSGQIRFTIEGQEPFVATKGFLAQAPFRTPYRMEALGDEPAVRFEVVQADATPLFPISETPTPAPGREYVRVSYTGRGDYDAVNKPYLDFQRDVVAANGRGGPFVRDDHTFANIIRGRGAPPPPSTNLGHFHIDYNEFWLVLEGKVYYLIEGQELFTAEVGDVVYAPQGRWHRASFGGEGASTRLAINPRPQGLHAYQPPH